jgi:Uma2 family endonuclease
MSTVTRSGSITFEEFCMLVKDGQKADLIDGVIHMASPDNTNAGDLSVWLTIVVGAFVSKKKLGKLYHSRIAFRLGDLQAPEPDLAVVLKDRLHLVRRGYVAGPPDLAIEIVSPDSIDRDYEKKREQYQSAKVPEYWLVDEVEQKVTLLRLAANGKYREVRPRKGELRSEVLPGFWLRPEWLWQAPLPEPTDVLALLLAE